MTTFIDFTPTQTSPPFQTMVTLDGSSYAVVAAWNLFAQRWYFSLYDVTNSLILTRALTGSPAGTDINLVWGYFSTSTLVFRQGTQQFEVAP
jgi:hypothetical protein